MLMNEFFPKRVILFRDFVREDKASLGIHTRTNWLTDDGPVGAVITVHRNRIVEVSFDALLLSSICR